jgi:hypothetical protein
MKSAFGAPAIVVAFMCVSPPTAGATTIAYVATPLGGSAWEYGYSLSGGSLSAQQGFAVFFDPSLYSTLALVGAAPQDWDSIVADPIADPQVNSPGYYDAVALVNAPPFMGPFRVSFIWLGAPGTIPGSQPAEFYQLDSTGAPIPFESLQTSPTGTAAVPEPSTLLLMSTGVALIRLSRTRRRQSDEARGGPPHALTENNLAV